jgi:hypothetical protein
LYQNYIAIEFWFFADGGGIRSSEGLINDIAMFWLAAI